MLTMSRKSGSTAACLQRLQHEVDFRLAEHRLLERLDVTDKSNALCDVGWHFGFEGAASNKGNDRVQMVRANAQRGLQSLEVFVVLPQWVLEFEGALVEFLRPLRLFLAAENPAAHVLRFQHEDAVDREEYVIDLRGAVGRIQGDVMQATVDLLVQMSMSSEAHKKFADMPFGPW